MKNPLSYIVSFDSYPTTNETKTDLKWTLTWRFKAEECLLFLIRSVTDLFVHDPLRLPYDPLYSLDHHLILVMGKYCLFQKSNLLLGLK